MRLSRAPSDEGASDGPHGQLPHRPGHHRRRGTVAQTRRSAQRSVSTLTGHTPTHNQGGISMIGNNVVAGKLESLRAAVRTMLTQLTVVEDEDIRGNYQGVLERADSVLETGVNRERKIMADTNLSATGQRNAIQALWKETLSALEFVGKKATSLQEAASSLRAELFAIPPTPKGVDPIMAYMREAEIRAWLSRLSKAEVLSKYMVAAQSGNAEMIRAVKLAPGEPMIEPAELDKIDAERV